MNIKFIFCLIFGIICATNAFFYEIIFTSIPSPLNKFKIHRCYLPPTSLTICDRIYIIMYIIMVYSPTHTNVMRWWSLFGVPHAVKNIFYYTCIYRSSVFLLQLALGVFFIMSMKLAFFVLWRQYNSIIRTLCKFKVFRYIIFGIMRN